MLPRWLVDPIEWVGSIVGGPTARPAILGTLRLAHLDPDPEDVARRR